MTDKLKQYLNTKAILIAISIFGSSVLLATGKIDAASWLRVVTGSLAVAKQTEPGEQIWQ